MASTEFDGRASEMRDSPWLASEDLDGVGEVKLTIRKVHKHTDVEFEAGRKKPVVYALEFEKAKRQLALNGTNRRWLAAKYGNNVQGWIGKEITLHVVNGIKVGRELKRGLRIK
jgi:hypothetical protein